MAFFPLAPFTSRQGDGSCMSGAYLGTGQQLGKRSCESPICMRWWKYATGTLHRGSEQAVDDGQGCGHG